MQHNDVFLFTGYLFHVPIMWLKQGQQYIMAY